MSSTSGSTATFDAYWKQMGIYAEGFYDQFSRRADGPHVGLVRPLSAHRDDNYIGLSRRKKGPVRLILGPWTHGDRSITYAGDVDFGPAATLDGNLAPDFLTLRLRWFDAWLKGERNGVATRAGRCGSSSWAAASGGRNAEGRLDHGGRWRAETRLADPRRRADGLSPAWRRAALDRAARRRAPRR